MALFTHNRGRNGKSARRVIVITEPAPCPQFLQSLEVLCTRHAIPIRMKCIGDSVSRSGDPMAVYACVYPGCNWREGWIQDRRSGRPFPLWKGVHRKRGQ